MPFILKKKYRVLYLKKQTNFGYHFYSAQFLKNHIVIIFDFH